MSILPNAFIFVKKSLYSVFQIYLLTELKERLQKQQDHEKQKLEGFRKKVR